MLEDFYKEDEVIKNHKEIDKEFIEFINNIKANNMNPANNLKDKLFLF